MGVTLAIQITSPVEPADLDLVSAVAMLLFAMGQAAPAATEEEEVPVEPPADDLASAVVPDIAPAPCGKAGEDGMICVGLVGHRGRHLMRRIYTAPGVN